MLIPKIIFIFAQWVCGRSYRPLITLKIPCYGTYGVFGVIWGFRWCWIRIWSQISEIFSSRGPSLKKRSFKKPGLGRVKIFRKKIQIRNFHLMPNRFIYNLWRFGEIKFLGYLLTISLWFKRLFRNGETLAKNFIFFKISANYIWIDLASNGDSESEIFSKNFHPLRP